MYMNIFLLKDKVPFMFNENNCDTSLDASFIELFFFINLHTHANPPGFE